MRLWNDKPYHSLDYELKKRFGEKVYRLALNGGMTCPNRDGTVGHGGCIFCSGGGSGEFASDPALSIREQIESGKERLSHKRPVNAYIAYFQAFTNTYAPVDYLRTIFTEAIAHPQVVLLSIATRPDCLQPEIVELLAQLNQIKPVWVELGLQTMHEDTAHDIRRGYPLSVFEDAVNRLRAAGLEVIVHTILGLPGEDQERMFETLHYLNDQDIQGIKLQLLHVLKNTVLEKMYINGEFDVLTFEEYADILCDCLMELPPDMVVHRFTGDGPKKILVAPMWSADKKMVLNRLNRIVSDL